MLRWSIVLAGKQRRIRSKFEVLKRTPQIVLAIIMVLVMPVLTGCARTLPDVAQIIEELPEADPIRSVAGSHLALPPHEKNAVLRRLQQQTGSANTLERHAALMELITGESMIGGNKVVLLQNGPCTYAAMLNAIENARDHINLETFIFKDDQVGNEFADLLLKKQAEGVQVNIIYDSLGSLKTPSSFFHRLKTAGVNILEFNPVSLFNLWGLMRIGDRDHRKILVVDGSIAFTGGVNIVEIYAKPSFFMGIGSEEKALEWRDTSVQIEGPAVAEFQRLFLDTWLRHEGSALASRQYYPVLREEGSRLVRVTGSSPRQKGYATAFLLYISAIEAASSSIHLTNSYFVPDRQMLSALVKAAKRDVDVKMIVPGVTDHMIAVYAGRRHYTELLKAGVKIYERQGMILHAKTAVIDGIWSTVGSANLDYISFARADEINATILSPDFAAEMEKMFEEDLQGSKQILLEDWKNRPLLPRFLEWFGYLFRYWL